RRHTRWPRDWSSDVCSSDLMTRSAAARYARDKIRFNVIAPGLIETPMSGRAVSDPAIRSYLAIKQPLADGPGTPDDCAEAALYRSEERRVGRGCRARWWGRR